MNFPSSGNPAYVVESGTLLDPVETMLNHLFLQLIIGLPLAIVIVAAGGYLLVRRALTPVERITRAAELITQHNLSERLPVSKTGDELERLSVSLKRNIRADWMTPSKIPNGSWRMPRTRCARP